LGSPKKIAKIVGLGLGLYAGTLVFYFAIVFPLCMLGALGNGFANVVAWNAFWGWVRGPSGLFPDSEFISWSIFIGWQLSTVILDGLISWRVGRATGLGWKVAIPVYLVLIIVIGLVGHFFFGEGRWMPSGGF
jgi:hypothetical protein